ncbi:MAG: hypothetical protein AB7T06_28120 [Kofleriaceae bacterium]
MRKLAVAVVLIGCGPDTRGGMDVDANGTVDSPPTVDANQCPPPPNAAGPDVQLAAPFDTLYTVYDLGQVPGVPNPLGGTVISALDPNTLLVAGASEAPDGAIYQIGVNRDACGHIIGFNGTATVHATTPYVDANLVYTSPDLLVYTEWPQYNITQLRTGSATFDRTTNFSAVGMDTTGDSGPGGLGLVPPNLAAANELRVVTWPGGRWFHVASAPDGNLLSITGTTQTQTLPNEPGGFAYVPAGSPGFTNQSLIVAEWRAGNPDADRVAVYEVDAQGDPMVSTRREFMSKFPRPWGAYFEPVTGDYLFLSWGTNADRVYIVQGFVPPPPIF